MEKIDYNNDTCIDLINFLIAEYGDNMNKWLYDYSKIHRVLHITQDYLLLNKELISKKLN
jgi:hypothetical protein